MLVLSKLVRLLVMLALTSFLARYFLTSLSKYRARRIGVTTKEQPTRASQFPAVVVCSEVGEYAPATQYQPWFRKVTLPYLDKAGVVKK